MAVATQKIVITADDKTGSAISSAVRNSQKLDKQLQKTSSSMRGMTRQGRAQMAQLGHQVQDIAVQLQMGMNPLMVLGQQGSQVASVFGTGGPLIGAFIAVGAVLASVLIPNLFKTAEGFDELNERVDALDLSMKNIAPFLFTEKKLDVEEQLRSAEKQFRSSTKELEALNEALSTGIGAPRLGSARTQYFDDLQKKITEARKEVERAKISLLEARKAAEEFEEVPLKDPPVAEVPLMPRIQDRPVAEFAPEKDPLEALRLRAEALKKSLDPMKAYQAELQVLQSMEANNLITTRELEQATEELRGRFLETSDAAKEFGLSMEDIKKTGIDSLENGLVSLIEGTKSVKDAFKDMARSVISSLIRMQIQQSITNPLASAMGIKRGAAIGGPMEGRKPYLVGEKGPELFIPSGSGRMKSNDEIGGSGVTVVQNLQISTGVSQTVRAEISNLLPQITNAAKAAVADARQRGGGYSKSLVGA